MPNGTTKTNGKNGNGNGNGRLAVSSIWPTWSHNRLFFVLTTCVFLGVISWFVVTVASGMRTYRFISNARTITIEGQGKVKGIPDIASVSLGLTVEKSEVRAAQKENADGMNTMIAALKKLGIVADDIQTADYSIYPQYDYTDKGQKLRGYAVTQSLMVKIRDLSKISDVLNEAGVIGLNQVGGINFEMDDPEILRQQARVKAMQNAKRKAEELASVAGVKLSRVVSFSEQTSGGYPRPMYLEKAYAMGGGSDAAPDIQAGSQDIIVNATVTYEIE